MKKSSEIKVNPEVLTALRETSGCTIDEVAKKLKTTATRWQRQKTDLPRLP